MGVGLAGRRSDCGLKEHEEGIFLAERILTANFHAFFVGGVGVKKMTNPVPKT